MFKYAQIDVSTGVCFAVSYLSGLVDSPYMLLLLDEDDVQTGDIYSEGEWTRPEQPPPVEPPPESDSEKITKLESELSATKSELSAAKDANLTTMSALADVFEMVLDLQAQIAGGAA